MQKRFKTVKRHFDELSVDHRFSSSEEIYRITVFLKVINIIVRKLESRFLGMSQVCESFSFLQPQTLTKLIDTEIISNANKLQQKYERDISTTFAIEMITFKNTFQSEIAQLSSIRDIAGLILVKNPELSSSFTEIISDIVLFLTLPVTVASNERSLSKLKLINNFMRTSIKTQKRLKALGLLAIEAIKLRKKWK